MARREVPEVNAGSMADIAFLLLIFFLVTTTIEKDSGIARTLPPIDEIEEEVNIRKRNLFIVNVNKDDQLLVNEESMNLKDLRQAAIEFIDNGGAPQGTADYCDFCKGLRDPKSSDNPEKAIISLQNDRLTSYKMYIAVQNELVAAYNELRNRESQRLYGWDYTEVKNAIAEGNYRGDVEKAEERLKEIQKMIPQKLSEAEPRSRAK
ncbi:MAG TPA: biopolymer transporter ExbD [Flavobacteriaceae bacterium]|nr:biopolymer transporter ExbD [Flavobacteriaceae bacterium]